MVSLFKEKSAVSVFWLIIICFGLHIQSLLTPPQLLISPNDGFIYYLLQPLQNAQPYFISLLYIFLIFLLALQLNFILNFLNMYPRQSYTAALAFLLYTALLPQFNNLSAALFITNFVVWILYSAGKLYASPKPKTLIYNFGLLTGLCVILYYASAPLILVAFVALAVIRTFHINEWFVLFFGLITPAYFLAAYIFLTDQYNLLPLPHEIFALVKLPLLPAMMIATLASSALIIVWSFFSVKNSGANVLIQIRKSWTVFLVAFFLFIPVVFFIKGSFPLVLLLAIIPASAYTGFSFLNVRNILPVIFFWLLIGLSIYNNWFAKY